MNDKSDNFSEPERTQISTILALVGLWVDGDFSGDCEKKKPVHVGFSCFNYQYITIHDQ